MRIRVDSFAGRFRKVGVRPITEGDGPQRHAHHRSPPPVDVRRHSGRQYDAFAARLAQTYPFAEPQVDYTPPDGQAFEVVASLLPDGVAQALLRTCASTLLVSQALLPQAAGGDGAIPALPAIRVAEAIRANAV